MLGSRGSWTRGNAQERTIARMKRSERRRWPPVVVCLLLLAVPGPIAAQELAWRPFLLTEDDLALSPAERVSSTPSCPEYRLLSVTDPFATCGSAFAGAAPDDTLRGGSASSQGRHELPYRAKNPQPLLVGAVALASAAGVFANSYFGYDHKKWHFTNEGFFGATTGDGGADKASHFADYYIVSREFAYLFEMFGLTENAARWSAFGAATFTGLVNEIGDGFTRHGFSYEDFVMDFLGAGTAAVVSAARVEDLVGVRSSHLPGPTYSHDVYSADLKLAGLARRLGLDVGPLRFLLASVTYASKGYRVPGTAPDQRQRQVGFEVGINLEEILNTVKARRDTWWGYALHVVGDNIRFPYLAIGMRYDLNHDRWHGPNNGNYP